MQELGSPYVLVELVGVGPVLNAVVFVETNALHVLFNVLAHVVLVVSLALLHELLHLVADYIERVVFAILQGNIDTELLNRITDDLGFVYLKGHVTQAVSQDVKTAGRR